MAEYSSGFKQMSKLISILKEHAKCDMIERSLMLRKGKFFVRSDEQGGNYDVNRRKLLDTFNVHERKISFLKESFELWLYCIKIIFFDIDFSKYQLSAQLF